MRLSYRIEAAAVIAAFTLFRLLPMDWASALGGWIGRTVGPRLGASRKAERNLALALPGLDERARRRVVVGMWDNLGRVMAEYPHLGTIARAGRVVTDGCEAVTAMAQAGKPFVMAGGHLANWEVLQIAADQLGVTAPTMVYRAPNNPLVDRLLTRARAVGSMQFTTKGAKGARVLLERMREGGAIAMLVDQKMNDGIPVPFFGRPAMTAPAAAQLALRFDCPLVVARAERLNGARFRITSRRIEPPGTGDRNADIAQMTAEMTAVLEGWIRERPEQWLWLHRRWPD